MDKTFTFQDIFTKKFLELFSLQKLDLADLGITLAVCLALGLGIYLLYRLSFSGALYDHTFAVSLTVVALITGVIIKAIASNVVLSLGMVGALSIVRFRTALKNPIDIVFMFWSIAVGIICGAGLYLLAVIGSVVVAGVLFVMTRTAGRLRVYLLVLRGGAGLDDAAVAGLLKANTVRYSLKSKLVEAERVELSYEVKLRRDKPDVTAALKGLPHLEAVSLVNYDPNAAP